MTTRETLTHYTCGDSRDWQEHYDADEVDARDQAREAAIREWITTWREAADSADQVWTTESGREAMTLRTCADELESLLTPTQEREP